MWNYMLLERRSYITSHPWVNKRVQRAEEGLPYLHLTYFILWESSILKGKERKRNCWGGHLAAGWTTVFKERDKWEISPESTKRVNRVFLSFLHTRSRHFELFHVATISTLLSSCSRVTSRVTLLGFMIFLLHANIYTFDHLQLMLFLFCLFVSDYYYYLFRRGGALQLQRRHLMRATGTERWPVFVCLWAKRHWLCCVRLSSHCSVKLNTAWGSPESAGCRWQVTDRS